MVADRADAAQALHHHRQLPVRAALDKFFKTAKLDDVQAGLLDFIIFIQQQRDFTVAFNAGNRVDSDPF